MTKIKSDRKIHKLHYGINMRSPYYRSSCGRWNDLKMVGTFQGKEVTCKTCLRSMRKKERN